MATAAEESRILSAALDYAGRGWRVLPLREGKIPRPKAWQRVASCDESIIERWWQENPSDNVGVRLGEASGIIDIECDSPEAEEMLLRLFDGDPPVTPTFSAKRGKHRLFRWRLDLPAQDKAVFKFGALEFRTGNGDKGAQSVFPPSIHPSGVEYAWLVHPDDAPVAELSDAFIAKLHNNPDGRLPTEHTAKPQEHWAKIAQGVSEGSRNEAAASFIGKLLRDLRDPFDADSIANLWELVTAWNCRNRPPIKEAELKATYSSILKRHQQTHANEHAAERINRHRPTDPTDEAVKTTWRLVIVESRPRVFRLYSPLWAPKTAHGYIELTAEQLISSAAIRVQAAEQADTWVPKSFETVWNGSKEEPALGRQLMESAEYQPAPLESKRDLVIAEGVYEFLDRARLLKGDEKPDVRGMACRLEDGSVAFKFGPLWTPMNMSGDKVKRQELVDVLRIAGVVEDVFWINGKAVRLKVASGESQQRLASMIGRPLAPARVYGQTGQNLGKSAQAQEIDASR